MKTMFSPLFMSVVAVFLLPVCCFAAVDAAAGDMAPGIQVESFGNLPDGREVFLYTLTNINGMEARIINFGAIVQALKVPDRNGVLADVVLGFDKLEGYVAEHPYFGAVVGRYGNRIAKGQFTLDDNTYTLAINNAPNALHGGVKGFDKLLWAAEPFDESGAPGLRLRLESPDGDEGYPGTLTVTVTYVLTNDNALKIHYHAVTDAPTVLNLTSHGYFNLDGAGSGDILGHEIMINADRFTPVDETLIPTGELRPVADTPFDFRASKSLGRDIGADDEQIRFGLGYDHNFVLNKDEAGVLTLAARVKGPQSGRVMEVHTTEPGMQFYSGNFLDSSNVGKGGMVYAYRFGFCMETQHYPDSPNQPDFPSTVLRPGETYDTTTLYRFWAE